MAEQRPTLNADMMPARQSTKNTSSSRNTSGRSNTNRSSNSNTNGSKNTKKKLTKKQRQKKKRRIFWIEVAVLVVLLILLAIYSFWMRVNQTDLDEDNLGINTELDEKFAEGYTTIALFGLDNRSNGSYSAGNSDCIIVATINNDTKEVKMVSVYRDTCMSVGDGQFQKANAAYQRGGMEQAIAMLNTNLDLAIKEYVSVDFNALVKVIDALGGIELEITDSEVQCINPYIEETAMVTGKTANPIYSAGTQLCDGCQAVGYARIRYTAGDDFMRTVRQRIVIQKIIDKAKTANLATLVGLCNDVIGDVSTSLSLGEAIGLAAHVNDYTIAGTTGFPSVLTTEYIYDVSYVVPVNMEQNVKDLHQYLYNDEDYETTNTVRAISEKIAELSGVSYDFQTEYNLDKYLNLADPAASTEDTENSEE